MRRPESAAALVYQLSDHLLPTGSSTSMRTVPAAATRSSLPTLNGHSQGLSASASYAFSFPAQGPARYPEQIRGSLVMSAGLRQHLEDHMFL